MKLRKARYVSKDPIGLFGGLNNSSYVSDPNQWVDPLGLNENKIISSGGYSADDDNQTSSDDYSYGRGNSYQIQEESGSTRLTFDSRDAYYASFINRQMTCEARGTCKIPDTAQLNPNLSEYDDIETELLRRQVIGS